MNLKDHRLLKTVVKNLEGEIEMRVLPPTQKELEEARTKGQERVTVREVPMTVGWAICNALAYDLAKRDPRTGQVFEPDPHEADKFKCYDLRRKIMEATEGLELESEEVTLIKDRARKIYTVDQFGFIQEFMKNSNPKIPTSTDIFEAEK